MKHLKIFEEFGGGKKPRDPRTVMEAATWDKAKELKMVVLADHQMEDDPVYFVVGEKGDEYQVVIDEKMDLWFNNPHKATAQEKEYYYSEWDKKTAFVEYKIEE